MPTSRAALAPSLATRAQAADVRAVHLELYTRAARIRAVEEAIAAAYGEQRMRCPVHLSIGQEAVSAGVSLALAPQDVLFGTHRSHGPYVAKGGSLTAMFRELLGKAGGCTGGRGGSMHLVDLDAGFWGAVPIVGSTIPIATGAALAFRMRNEARVSMVVFGEGATEEGVFHESLQYAVLRKLPVIYICENNGFSVNTPWEERRPKGLRIYELAQAHGLRVGTADGNDAIAVYEAVSDVVEDVRIGRGPAFLEFETYRWMEHCGPGDDHHLPCRSKEAYAAWKSRCPLATLERNLMRGGLTTHAELEALRAAVTVEVAGAMAEANAAPFPEASHNSDHIYAEVRRA